MIANADFVIIGAGIVGLAIARERKNRRPTASIVMLEKEPEVGLHSSGRNSGVLHSGIYYPAQSLKARVCATGAREMADYCVANRLPLKRIGKILVPVTKADASQLKVLAGRAAANGVTAEQIDAVQLKELEPEARSASGSALFVASTAVGNASAVVRTVAKKVSESGVDLRFGARLANVDNARRELVFQDGSRISYGHAINTAGLHADTVAHRFGVGRRYTLLPFKGIYWKLSEAAGFKLRHLIYPVPDLRVPFLGVHTPTSWDGIVYLGPTAVPAFGRENYCGLQGVNPIEAARISALLLRQFIAGRNGFRQLTWQEGRRYFKRWFAEAAQALLRRLRAEHLLSCDKVGIRAQMYDRKARTLVTDFLVERGDASTHVLNAISPAWTSAFPFARYVIENFVEQY